MNRDSPAVNPMNFEHSPLMSDKEPSHKPPLAEMDEDPEETNTQEHIDLTIFDGDRSEVDGIKVPHIGSRLGEEDDVKSTAGAPSLPNGTTISATQPPAPSDNVFPYPPGFPRHDPRFDFELGGPIDLDSIPDVNVYQHKKTLAQGMMDLALFSANANQLRYILETSSNHPYFYPSLIMISISLIFQVAIGVGLIWNSRYNVKDKREICIANKINNYTVIGIFLVTSINVFISAFGVASAPAPVPVLGVRMGEDEETTLAP